MPRRFFPLGTVVEVIPPDGDSWMRAVIVGAESTAQIEIKADPVWGGCILTRWQYRKIRELEVRNGSPGSG